MGNKSLWAKKQENAGCYQWLPLSQHLIDTMLVAGLLWEHWLNPGQRQFITQSLRLQTQDGADIAKRVVMLLGAVHDIGKATPAFQKHKRHQSTGDLEAILLEKLEYAGFCGISTMPELSDQRFSHHALAGQVILSSYGVKDDISSIVGAHHGKPIDNKSSLEIQIPSYTTNYFQVEDENDPIYQKWNFEQRRIFQWALRVNNFNNIDELPTISQPAQVILSGLLIMADWIASNESYFPLLYIDEDAVNDQEARINYAKNKWFISKVWLPVNHSDVFKLYNKRFGDEQQEFRPRNVQAVMSQIISNTENPGIFILEAPMGIGKTEAALVAAEQLANKCGRSGMFFGLPTQATSDGIFPRIKNWLERISADTDCKMQLRLVHGKSELNPVFEKIRESSNYIVDNDGNSNSGIIVNEWFSGRKTSNLDDFIVGTVDQFLLVALKQKHLSLRHLGFSKKVVIIDEVHAYDAYMSQYLERAIHWMGTYRVPIVILSATLPAEQRQRLLKSYVDGLGYDWRREVSKPETGLQTDDYPLITYNDGSIIKQHNDFEKGETKTVKIRCIDEEQLFQHIDDFLAGKGVVGIIVNTVKRAQKIAKRCVNHYGENVVELLHSGFISTHRISKERKLLEMIGKNAKRPDCKIIVGTQVIEQSLDIDFDVLISDLAPMDLLLQRVGRLHRHDIKRPSKFKEPVLYVLGTSNSLDFEAGSSSVYGGYLLARTQSFLPGKFLLPDHISTLVQKVYGSEELEFSEEIQIKYNEMKKTYFQYLEDKKEKADVFKLAKPTLKKSYLRSDSLIGWLKYHDISANKSEERAYAQVRDTNETIEIIALKKLGSGYSLFDNSKDLSLTIDEISTAKTIAQQTIRLPNHLCSLYSYKNSKGEHTTIIDQTISELEEYNIIHLSNWQKSPWLKGSLGIIFDENNQFVLNGHIITYNMKIGLTSEEV